MSLIPVLGEIIDITHQTKSPISHKKLEIPIKNKNNLIRLACYEVTGIREDKSPSSLISQIKHYIVLSVIAIK